MNKEVKELIDTMQEYASGGVSGLHPFEESVKALLDYINQLETNRDEAIKELEILRNRLLYEEDFCMEEVHIDEAKEILERGKE